MRIAVIGAGKVGRALGGGWSRAGHAVAYGVPDPADPKHADLPAASRHGVAAAVAGAEIVVLAVPWGAVADALAAAGDLAGRVVIDCTNPLAFTPGRGLHLALGFETSGAERLAALAPGARVVKTLNQTGAEVMGDAHAFPQRPVMFLAADDADAKAHASRLVADLGFEPRDAGPLAGARLLEPLAMLWIDQATARGAGRDVAFTLARKP